ncbi:MAG: hypothetical protein JJT99_12025 [Rhodobacteraceae bacterium]|nr:hypothetical protein [Paracoccaceae bacterium]
MADASAPTGVSLAERLYLMATHSSGSATCAKVAALGPLAAEPLLWLHAEGARRLHRLTALSERLLQDDRAGSVLLSYSTGLAAPADIPRRLTLELDEHDAPACAAVLARLQPSALLIASEYLTPTLISMAAGKGVPVMLAEIAAPRLRGLAARLPGLRRSLLSHCSTVFLTGTARKSHWTGAGLMQDPVILPGPLSDVPATLACNETERDVLAQSCRQRTVWLAVAVPEQEEALVIAAHRAALRQSLRVVLILHPLDPMRGAGLKAALEGRFMTALRSVDDPITPETQIYIADTDGERGLWYRLATTCYIGGSLGGPDAQVSPMEAAALGCAVVHGRAHGLHDDAFRQLRRAGAAAPVERAEMLGQVICEVLAPERAAELAHAGWELISEGAGTADAIIAALLVAAQDRKAA